MTNGTTRSLFIKESGMDRSGSTSTPPPEYCMDEDDFQSPTTTTDSSEDSVEVKVEAVRLNKRKCIEPKRALSNSTAPLKKRLCIRTSTEEHAPFRPWNNVESPQKTTNTLNPPKSSLVHVPSPFLDQGSNERSRGLGQAYFRPPSPITTHLEPIALVKNKVEPPTQILSDDDDDDDVVDDDDSQPLPLRVPQHPGSSTSCQDTESIISRSEDTFPRLRKDSHNSLGQHHQHQHHHHHHQRNYKNMTRERRIEANARERTRVHTISAAFETLRKSVPAYSHTQKLSKLSVLRIACSYIMTLSNMLEDAPQEETAQSVDAVTRTIQREGKLRKKKDED